MDLCLAGWTPAVAIVLLAAVTGGSARAASCQSVDDAVETFLTVYPTGGQAARFDGARADQVMQGLDVQGKGDEVVFLYSGDGPATGARGRYMYLILDPADCVLDSDWVGGKTFDRVRRP